MTYAIRGFSPKVDEETRASELEQFLRTRIDSEKDPFPENIGRCVQITRSSSGTHAGIYRGLGEDGKLVLTPWVATVPNAKEGPKAYYWESNMPLRIPYSFRGGLDVDGSLVMYPSRIEDFNAIIMSSSPDTHLHDYSI